MTLNSEMTLAGESPEAAGGSIPPALDLDPYTDENILDPEPCRKMIRDSGGIVYLAKYNVYATGRHEEVRAVYNDYETFSSAAGICLLDLRDPAAHSYRKPSPINEVDPPVHTKIRSGLQKLLSPVMVRSWRAQFEEVSGRVVDNALASGGIVDAVPAISEELIYTVIPQALGLDVPRAFLPALGEMNSFSMGPDTPRRRANLEEVKDALKFYNEATERKNVKPGTFGDKLFAAEDAGVFDPGVGAGLLRVFIRASTENLYSAVSALLHRLAENPDQWEKLKANPDRVKNAVEEVIRLDAPLEVDYRFVTRDTELNGYRLEANRKIGLFLTSANRDPRFWDRPDVFDIEREVMGRHLGFGAGPHVCIGQMIARLPPETLLRAMLERVDRIELAGRPERKIVSGINSLKSLPIRLIPK